MRYVFDTMRGIMESVAGGIIILALQNAISRRRSRKNDAPLSKSKRR